LCGKESEGVECYSPNKVVNAREYLATKEAVELAEAKAKKQRKIEKAANALRNKQLREEKKARQAIAQLAKDLQHANLTSQNTRPKQVKVVATKAKKTAIIVPKTKQTPLKANPAKDPVKKKAVQVVPTEVVVTEVVTTNRRGRPITLPTRFK
jgi:hypothetical protein